MASFVFLDSSGEEVGMATGMLPRKGDYVMLEDDGPRYRVEWVELLFSKGDLEYVPAAFQKVSLVQAADEVTYGEAEEGERQADDDRGVAQREAAGPEA